MTGRFGLLRFFRARLNLICVEDHDQFVSLPLNVVLGVHLEAVLGHFERVTNCVLLHKEGLVELSSEENGGVVHDRVPLLHADHMVDPCVVKNLTRELTVARRNKDELEA